MNSEPLSEWIARMENGRETLMSFRAATMASWPLPSTARLSHQPLQMSVSFSEYANSPRADGPLWLTSQRYPAAL